MKKSKGRLQKNKWVEKGVWKEWGGGVYVALVERVELGCWIFACNLIFTRKALSLKIVILRCFKNLYSTQLFLRVLWGKGGRSWYDRVELGSWNFKCVLIRYKWVEYKEKKQGKQSKKQMSPEVSIQRMRGGGVCGIGRKSWARVLNFCIQPYIH